MARALMGGLGRSVRVRPAGEDEHGDKTTDKRKALQLVVPPGERWSVTVLARRRCRFDFTFSKKSGDWLKRSRSPCFLRLVLRWCCRCRRCCCRSGRVVGWGGSCGGGRRGIPSRLGGR